MRHAVNLASLSHDVDSAFGARSPLPKKAVSLEMVLEIPVVFFHVFPVQPIPGPLGLVDH